MSTTTTTTPPPPILLDLADSLGLADSRKSRAGSARADSLPVVEGYILFSPSMTSTTTTTPTTTTDPPFSIDSPVSYADAFVSGLCPSGSEVSLMILPEGLEITGVNVFDTVWVAEGLDLTGATEVLATADGWATYESEPVVQATTTTTAATTATTGTTSTTAPPTTTEPPPATRLAIVHGNKVTFAEVSGTSLALGDDVPYSASAECASCVAMDEGRLAIVFGRGCGRCVIASAGGILAEDVSLGDETQLVGTSKGICGGGLAAVRSDSQWLAAAYADGGDCRGTVSRAFVGGSQVTTTTSTTTTSTTGTTTTTVTTTTTAPPGTSTTTLPPPPGAGREFRLASPFAPIFD